MELINLDDILSVDDSNNPTISLPKHQRCCFHNLNLIATNDAEKAENDINYKRISRTTFAKCFALINKQNMSPKMADNCRIGKIPNSSNKTRWNSYFQSMKLIAKMLSEKFLEVEEVCDKIGFTMFRQEECFYVKEYASVMEPLAISLKILEREDNMEQGYLTPVLTILIDKLKKFSCLRYCQPLVECVLRGIDKRFPSLYDENNILASIIHPKFRLNRPFINLPQNLLLKEG
ncbi:uncharacterized protein LOC135924357 [Gordionus sp. m RMFG-2023]|uniref:uncharacterized protein LOC135924357 n=1 Tax=Gordionus sp. m RMFG-2023 TaxID=3053472 RepID=UPI0031FC6548